MPVQENLVTDRVLDNFQHNITIIQQQLYEVLPQVSEHKHGIFCFPFCSCRHLEEQVRQDQGRVDEYRSVITELIINNNSQPAIDILRREASATKRIRWYQKIGSFAGYPYSFLEERAKQQTSNIKLRLASDLEAQILKSSS